MDARIATPEFIEARKPIIKWIDMYMRGVITQSDLSGRLTDYALSFKLPQNGKEVTLEGFPQPESSYRIQKAMEHLKTMPKERQIDLMMSANLLTPEQAETAKRKLRDDQTHRSV